jgi:hypothetical protein
MICYIITIFLYIKEMLCHCTAMFCLSVECVQDGTEGSLPRSWCYPRFMLRFT